MGRYKLIALDMDGTLLNDKQEISAENRKWIQAAVDAGITVCMSTGRGIQSAVPYIEELRLQTPIVTVNGSEVWQKPNELLTRHLMDVDIIREMHKIAIRYDTWFWSYSVQGIFNKNQWTADIASHEWLKFGYLSEDTTIRQKIREILQSWGTLEITNSHPTNIELNPRGINKQSGVEEICRVLGIKLSEVVAMGDSLNDLSMIRGAGLGVAMGNAQEELKAAADLVTLSNEEDGVAKVIKEIVLELNYTERGSELTF